MFLAPSLRDSILHLSSFMLLGLTLPVAAQQTSISGPYAVEVASLPDSPGAMFDSRTALDVSLSESPSPLAFAAEDGGAAAGQARSPHVKATASHRDKYIDPGQQAPALSASDKFQLGVRNSASPFSVIGWLTSAGYSQAIDNAPNYGQGWGPFAQRFGAAAARASSEGVFSDALFAPLFHEDPRYYRLGRGHNIVHRGLYAATRALITRTDSGRPTPNFSLLAGNAAGSILTNAYYPDRNRDVTTTVETFAGSIGGSALGFVVSEFLSDTLGVLHLKRVE